MKIYNKFKNENGASTLPIGSRQDRNGLADPILLTSNLILARSILEYLLGVQTREVNIKMKQNGDMQLSSSKKISMNNNFYLIGDLLNLLWSKLYIIVTILAIRTNQKDLLK